VPEITEYQEGSLDYLMKITKNTTKITIKGDKISFFLTL